jgi:dihydroneopterin aldolase
MSPMADPQPTRIFVRNLIIEAQIGIHPHEQDRRQPLIVEVELAVDAGVGRSIGETVNYETIVDHAVAIADSGHIGLLETYARRVAQACMAESRVRSARVRVEKPLALAPRAAVAGVEITLFRQ